MGGIVSTITMYPATPLPHWSYETPPPYWYPKSGVAGHMAMVDVMRPPIRLPHCARTIVSGSFNGAPSSQGAAHADRHCLSKPLY